MKKPTPARRAKGTSTKPAVVDLEYEFVRRDPLLGYMDNNLWIPKAGTNVPAVLASLTFNLPTGEKLCLGSETETHLIVPRHYLDGQNKWFEMVDDTPTFEKVVFEDLGVVRPNQQAAWDSLKIVKNGTLNLACGKGKTFLALKKIALIGHPAIVIVNQGGTLKQWAEAAEMFLGETPTVVQANKTDWSGNIVLATIQTLSKRAGTWPLEMRRRFGMVVVDECHHMSAPKFSQIADMFFGDRLGLTATPKRADGTEVVYYQHLGGIFFSDMTQDLVPTVFMQETITTMDLESPKVVDCFGKLHIQKMRIALETDLARVSAVTSHLKKAVDAGRKVLVLGHSVDGLTLLAEKAAAKLGIPVGLITGSTSLSLRMSIFRDNQVVVASVGVAAEALDAPALDTIMFYSPFRPGSRLIQGVGRILRTHSGKKDPIVVVFVDKKIPPCRGLSRALQTALVEEGYRVKLAGP